VYLLVYLQYQFAKFSINMLFVKRFFYIPLLVYFLLLNNSCKDKNDKNDAPVISANDVTTITVKISKITELKGKLHIALFDNVEDWKSDVENDGTGHEFKIMREDVVEDGQKVTFEDVPAGTYAISMYHDIDDNGELNRTVGIIPAEPYGFSNNEVPGLGGAPKFEKCNFSVDEMQSIELNIDLIGS